jgi:8-oxo-dGTP pyrophosphatase MutT (NUDIX family)
VVTTPSPEVAADLAAWHVDVRVADPASLDGRGSDLVVLIGDELGRAGEHAEGLLAASAAALRAGGLLVAAARNRVHAEATGAGARVGRTWSAAELIRAVGHPGIAVEHVIAPGAAAALRGEPHGAVDRDLDASAGLLDAAPHTLVLGRRPADPVGRSEAFFASVPRKLVAAAVVCRDGADRLLCVHDTFKQHWTIPGGVVDADEDPQAGAVRETWEEAGVRVDPDALLGVFAMRRPDRVLLVYGAHPVGDAAPAPVHAHEVDAAEWLPLPAALARLNPTTSSQVRRCLDQPGATWSDRA